MDLLSQPIIQVRPHRSGFFVKLHTKDSEWSSNNGTSFSHGQAAATFRGPRVTWSLLWTPGAPCELYTNRTGTLHNLQPLRQLSCQADIDLALRPPVRAPKQHDPQQCRNLSKNSLVQVRLCVRNLFVLTPCTLMPMLAERGSWTSPICKIPTSLQFVGPFNRVPRTTPDLGLWPGHEQDLTY